MVPAREDHPPVAVDDRPEVARWCVIKQPEIAGLRIEAPQPGIGQLCSVFVYLWIEMARSVSGPLRRKNDPVIRAATRMCVVELRGLVEHLGDGRRFKLREARYFIDLPGRVRAVGL